VELGIKGHVALITGGGRGLGAGMATALGAEGCTVVVWDRDREPAEAVADAIRADGGSATAVVADVCDPAAVNTVVADVTERFRTVHILVNCAGFSRDAPIAQMTDQQWQEVIDVCLTAPFYVTRAVVPTMMKQGYGRIVNISSRARTGDRNKVNYAAAKAGIVGFTEALALELGKDGITANAIAPGYVETERARSITYAAELKARALELTPTARLGELADISDALCYLVARQSGYITGEVLTVAGGRWR